MQTYDSRGTGNSTSNIEVILNDHEPTIHSSIKQLKWLHFNKTIAK